MTLNDLPLLTWTNIQVQGCGTECVSVDTISRLNVRGSLLASSGTKSSGWVSTKVAISNVVEKSLRSGKVQGGRLTVWPKPWHCGEKVENKKQDAMYFHQNESFHSVYSKTLALFPITLHDSKSNSHSMTSLLRHHPSAVSCDDSDLLLEESCVMDISTEVKR